MITTEDIQRLLGSDAPVVAEDGSKIGAMGEVFFDTATGEPAWVTVHGGLFGKESFVPLIGAVARGEEIHVPFGKDVVKHAPRPESADGRLSPDEERALYRHYGLLHDAVPATDGAGTPSRDGAAPSGEDDRRTGSLRYPGPVPSPDPVPPAGDLEAAGPVPEELAGATPSSGSIAADSAPADDAAAGGAASGPDDGSMVRSEERVHVVGTEQVPTERVRMRRYTVTEEKTVTVPVRREVFRLEYEPADGEGDSPDSNEVGADGPASDGTDRS